MSTEDLQLNAIALDEKVESSEAAPGASLLLGDEYEYAIIKNGKYANFLARVKMRESTSMRYNLNILTDSGVPIRREDGSRTVTTLVRSAFALLNINIPESSVSNGGTSASSDLMQRVKAALAKKRSELVLPEYKPSAKSSQTASATSNTTSSNPSRRRVSSATATGAAGVGSPMSKVRVKLKVKQPVDGGGGGGSGAAVAGQSGSSSGSTCLEDGEESR